MRPGSLNEAVVKSKCTLIETAKLNGVDPHSMIQDCLREPPTVTTWQI